MYLKLLALVCMIALCFCVVAPEALAHEFIIKPVVLKVQPGETVPFSVVSAHKFMVSEEVEPIEFVKVALVSGSGSTPAPLTENQVLMTLDGQVKPEAAGTVILAGHRESVIWTNTSDGWKQGSKKGLSGVISSGKYEKFCKTLLTVGQSDDGYKKVLGHKLEIVPLSDPAGAGVGDYLGFRILFDNKPVAGEVLATYDGFADKANTYAYFTETDENDEAWVKITHPGTWMVRVQQKIDQPTDDYNEHVIRSVLVFQVD